MLPPEVRNTLTSFPRIALGMQNVLKEVLRRHSVVLTLGKFVGIPTVDKGKISKNAELFSLISKYLLKLHSELIAVVSE